MKTKYENFLEHLIHGIDEPQRTFLTHNKIGFTKDKFALKGKILSATKIFLSDDFVNNRFTKYSKKASNDLDKKINNTTCPIEIRKMHKKLFRNSLPLYDNMLILFPFTMTEKGEGEFMAGCWIQKIIPSKELVNSPSRIIKDESLNYTITTFDNSCKYQGYNERLNLSLMDYFIDFNGGIETKDVDIEAKEYFMTKAFGDFIEPVKESYKSFIDFFPSVMQGRKIHLQKYQDILRSGTSYQSQLSILAYLNLLHFINSKGSETITFKSSLPIKKRSNVIKGFEYKMLEVKKENRITTRYGDSINKNRLHQVRGHMRHYQSGKRTWIKSHERGDEKMGVIIKDYNFK
jgi:hypothetical protein